MMNRSAQPGQKLVTLMFQLGSLIKLTGDSEMDIVRRSFLLEMGETVEHVQLPREG